MKKLKENKVRFPPSTKNVDAPEHLEDFVMSLVTERSRKKKEKKGKTKRKDKHFFFCSFD